MSLFVGRTISRLITWEADKKGKLWQELVIDGKKVAAAAFVRRPGIVSSAHCPTSSAGQLKLFSLGPLFFVWSNFLGVPEGSQKFTVLLIEKSVGYISKGQKTDI